MVVDGMVSVTFIPVILFVTTNVSISDTVGSHKVRAEMLKLIETLTCASKQRCNGKMTGANPQVG